MKRLPEQKVWCNRCNVMFVSRFHASTPVELGNKEEKCPGFCDLAKLQHRAKFVSPFDTWKKIKNDRGSL